jgi:polysaccharide export outer membrane protein
MKKPFPILAVLAAAVLSLTPGLAGAQEEEEGGAGDTAADPAATPVVTAATAFDSPLMPGDSVRVLIWQEPDLSGTFRVDETSVLTLPMLGPVRVAGMTAAQLRQRLMQDYSTQLRNPSIDVTILRRVSVLGAVRQPGLYEVDPTMRVSDVIAMAGGVGPEGDDDDIRILRNGVEVAEVELTGPIGASVRSGDQIVVGERGWLARNERWVMGIGATVTALLLRQAF